MTAPVIVVGNEKGGTGKSTIAMHLVVSLLTEGLRVGTIDLDARQATLSRYVENRARSAQRRLELAMPEHHAVPPSGDAENDRERFNAALESVSRTCDVVVIDTPGSDHPLSHLGHAQADILVTPLNDSLVDLDVLARVDPETFSISRPSHYSEMVWDARKRRAIKGLKTPQWFVMRNRLSMLDARNKREMDRLITELASRIGFTVVAGLSERVIYRELFVEGLTLLDLGGAPGTAQGAAMTMSHVAARQELRRLCDAIGLKSLAKTAASVG